MNKNEKYNTYSFLLERTARSVKQFAQRKFNEVGFEVTVDQWQVLKVLYDNNDLNQREIAELTYKDHPTLTRIIDLLCKKALVERKIHPSDRRSFIIHLTEEGKEKVEFMKPQVAEIRTHAWHNLSDADFEEFKRILNTIYTNLSL